MALRPTPSQTVGPFFAYALNRPDWHGLGTDGAKGERIIVEGRVTDGDGAPIPDCFLELWQANAAGKYDHPDDRQDKPVDPAFRGFGRVPTDVDGRFRFLTIRPGRVPGRGNTLQAPHIAVALFSRGLLRHLHTRIYFEGEAANETDPVLGAIDDPAARRTLVARREAGKEPATYRFDIVLQGAGETAFFDL
jgi:protocatechuate 3,4-dioxygenase alpha subunit